MLGVCYLLQTVLNFSYKPVSKACLHIHQYIKYIYIHFLAPVFYFLLHKYWGYSEEKWDVLSHSFSDFSPCFIGPVVLKEISHRDIDEESCSRLLQGAEERCERSQTSIISFEGTPPATPKFLTRFNALKASSFMTTVWNPGFNTQAFGGYLPKQWQ